VSKNSEVFYFIRATDSYTQSYVEDPPNASTESNYYHFTIHGCCLGRVGDANGLGGDEPTISDVSTMVDMLFISEQTVACLAEADINQSGGADPTPEDITISDISILVDYLFITGEDLGLNDCL
jgi:hypothetical protein